MIPLFLKIHKVFNAVVLFLPIDGSCSKKMNANRSSLGKERGSL